MLAILSVSRLYAVCTGNSGALLMMTGHQKTMMRITMVSAAVGLTTELLVVRPFGIVGVAVATSIAQIIQNTLQLVYGKRRVGVPGRMRSFRCGRCGRCSGGSGSRIWTVIRRRSREPI